jgi:predicted O-methyltransferase YrrM
MVWDTSVSARSLVIPSDPFAQIKASTDTHRRAHGCWAYPFGDGPTLGVLAAAVNAGRILELGTALGYTACWLAHGSPSAQVDTIERDPDHAQLAAANSLAAGFSSRIRIIGGEFDTVLPTLTAGYDIVFFDGYAPTPKTFSQIRDLLRRGGVLISANLDLGGDGEWCRQCLCDDTQWLTSFMAENGRTAVSVKL